MTKGFAICGVLALAGVLTLQALASPARSQPEILESEQIEGFVSVEEVVFQRERVSGVIVNRRSRPLRDVRLLISIGLDGFVRSGDWEVAGKDVLHDRLAADFTGWEEDGSTFTDQVERLVKTLRA